MKQALQPELTWPVYGVVIILIADRKNEKKKMDNPLQESTARSLGEAVLQYYKTVLSCQNFTYIHADRDYFYL